MSEFERKLIQGVHDGKWTGKIAGFRSSAGVREYPIEPDDQDVNPDRSVPVVVFTAEALAAELRKAKAEALREAAEETYRLATAEGVVDANTFAAAAMTDYLRARAAEMEGGKS